MTFFFVAKSEERCNELVNIFLNICKRLSVPISDEKTEWACSSMVFLGLLLDRDLYKISIPQEKVDKAKKWLNLLIDKKKATVQELQSLAGLLNFLNRAIYLGHAFTRRMYSKFTGSMDTLKKYHHLHLDREFKDDC